MTSICLQICFAAKVGFTLWIFHQEPGIHRKYRCLGKCLSCTKLVSFVILKIIPNNRGNLCCILAELHTMSWKDSSFGLWYTTCWMGDYVTSVIQYRLFLFYQSQTQSALILALPTFHLLFCLFSDIVTFLLSFLSLPFRQDLQFPVLGGVWNIQNLFISEAILRHLVPHGQFVTMWNARRCPWGWPLVIALPDTRKKKKRRK